MEENIKILLCEDDENLGMLLREYLQAKGYETTLCTDGDAGYKAFLKDKFDLCVLDVMMPKLDGLRGQIHFDRARNIVEIYSRNMENMTAQYPEIVHSVKELDVDSIILDSEIIGFKENTHYLCPAFKILIT